MTIDAGRFSPAASGGYLLQFDQVYPTDAADLWDAVTSRDRLSRWMAPYEGALRLCGDWRALSDDGSTFVVGTVTECDAPHSFTTTWHAREEQPTVLTVTVEPAEGGARLRLDHDGIGSLDYGGGWQTYLELLELDVLGDVDAIGAFDWDARYQAIRPGYRD